MTRYFFKQHTEKGAVVIVAVILFIIISSSIIFAIANPLAEQVRGGSDFIRGAQAYVNAKASNEDVLYRLNKGYALPGQFSFTLNHSSSSAEVTDFGTIKQVISEGVAEQLSRTIHTSFTQTPHIAFMYAVQVGEGGLVIDGGSIIDGSVSTTTIQSLPIRRSHIDGWKQETNGGTIHDSSWVLGGGVTASTTGPTKIEGNLTISDGAILILNGALYVTGDINVSGGGKIKLSSDLGTYADVILVDGKTILTGGGSLEGNSTAGSYIVLVSTNTAEDAINASGGTNSAVLVAQDGGVSLSGGTTTGAVIAHKVNMTGGSHVYYKENLSDLIFSGSSSSLWSVLRSFSVL